MSEKPPITLIQRNHLTRNAVFDLWLDHVRGDDGTEVPRYLVVDPLRRTPEGLTGVGIVPIVDGECLLLRIYRHPVRRWGWEIPRGFVEPGENPAQAALRELQEETGYDCPPDALIPLGEVSPEPGVINARIMLFAATRCFQDGRPLGEELGRADIHCFPITKILAMTGSQDLYCATTMASILRYMAYSNGNPTCTSSGI